MKFKNDEAVFLMGRNPDLPHTGKVMKMGGWIWPLMVLLLCAMVNMATYLYAWIMDRKVWEFPNSVNVIWYGTVVFLLMASIFDLRGVVMVKMDRVNNAKLFNPDKTVTGTGKVPGETPTVPRVSNDTEQ